MFIRRLTLSGDCILPETCQFPALRDLTLDSVNGNHLDRRDLATVFSDSQLIRFCYRMGGMGSFELRDTHIASLRNIGTGIQYLTLVGCSRLSGEALITLFEALHKLIYLALDVVTVRELQVGFIDALSTRLEVLKFAIVNVRYAPPLIIEESHLCDEIESLMRRQHPPRKIYLKLREAHRRRTEWSTLAQLDLRWGNWKAIEFG